MLLVSSCVLIYGSMVHARSLEPGRAGSADQIKVGALQVLSHRLYLKSDLNQTQT